MPQKRQGPPVKAMGKKISFLSSLKLGIEKDQSSIYAKPNKYGYKLNVNNPQIKPFYERYKKKLGEKILSDNQRLTFETIIFQAIAAKKGR